MGARDVAPMSYRKTLVGMVKEATRGTQVPVVAAMANTVTYDAVFKPGRFFEEGDRLPDGTTYGQFPKSIGMQKGEGSFKSELRHNDQTFALLELAGFTLSGAGTLADPLIATPSPDFAAQSTASFRCWEDGAYQDIFGAVVSRATLAPIKPGGRLMWEWNVEGVWGGDGDQAIPSAPAAFDAVALFRAAGITAQFGGADIPHFSTFNLDVGITSEEREDLISAQAVAHMLVGQKLPSLTLDPESRKVADYDAIGKYESGITEAIAMGFTDPSGNVFQIDAAAAQRSDFGRAQRGNKKADQWSLDLCITDSLQDDLVFTRHTAA